MLATFGNFSPPSSLYGQLGGGVPNGRVRAQNWWSLQGWPGYAYNPPCLPTHQAQVEEAVHDKHETNLNSSWNVPFIVELIGTAPLVGPCGHKILGGPDVSTFWPARLLCHECLLEHYARECVHSKSLMTSIPTTSGRLAEVSYCPITTPPYAPAESGTTTCRPRLADALAVSSSANAYEGGHGLARGQGRAEELDRQAQRRGL